MHQPKSLHEVMDFCLEVGLPISLADIGVDTISQEELLKVAEIACIPEESIHAMPFPITVPEVAAAIAAADRMGREYKAGSPGGKIMKKIINQAEHVVMEMCNGIALAHPELEFLKKYKVIKRREIQADKVSLISGGGSGHEPAHAGYVGKGMLDAAVCGDVFASPSQIQVYQAIKATASNKGTLLIIKNYSGDMMNFKNAAHLAEEDGINVQYVRVEDDIAVQDSLYTVGRRGVAGTVLVHKIAGAAAEEGRSLADVKSVAEKAGSERAQYWFWIHILYRASQRHAYIRNC